MAIITNDFSNEVYKASYKYETDSCVEDTLLRVARAVSLMDTSLEHDFYEQMASLKLIPSGRILSNAGVGLKGTSLINCFVDGFWGSDQDSLEGINTALYRQAKILKTEGGYGFCADVMRPRGAYISGIGGESCGAVKMLELWNTQSIVYTSGNEKKVDTGKQRGKNKIRNGAQMVTMSVWHPDILEFIDAKSEQGKLTKTNMSVLITDEFMNAVENDDSWELKFPDYERSPLMYASSWDGDINSWIADGGWVRVYKRIQARQLWGKIIKAAYARNEPGLLFIDRINYFNNLSYCETIKATNPCGEQPLPLGGACDLASINLTRYVINDNGHTLFDFDALQETVRIAVVFLDNVLEIANMPFKENVEEAMSKRRIGIGIMGLGSMLMMMRIRYGSDASLSLVERIMSTIANTAYLSSSMQARERGTFPLYCDDYLKSKYLECLSPSVMEHIKIHGIRNSHLISIQPTGTTAIFADNVSGGLEPVFAPSYVRTVRLPSVPSWMKLPKVDWINRLVLEHGYGDMWSFWIDGDEPVLRLLNAHDGRDYKYDQTRGLVVDVLTEDYAVRWLKKNNLWKSDADYVVSAESLSVDEHIGMMKVISKYVDSAMSKTVNVRADITISEFERIYYEIYKSGTIKGVTSYRAGTMASVLSVDTSSSKIVKTSSPERPKSLPANMHHLRGDLVMIVGLLDEAPYEAFICHCVSCKVGSIIRGNVIKVKSGVYTFDSPEIYLDNIIGDGKYELLTRLISLALRHGADIRFIFEQMNKGADYPLYAMIAPVLKRYITDKTKPRHAKCPACGGDIHYSQGCLSCVSCGWGKC